jgi:hypothetical protein
MPGLTPDRHTGRDMALHIEGRHLPQSVYPNPEVKHHIRFPTQPSDFLSLIYNYANWNFITFWE